MSDVLIFAHRGVYDNRTVFENTLPSFKKAIKRDLAIEFDIRMTKDEVIVVHHDENLKRIFKSEKRILKSKWDDIKSIQRDGIHIPTLKSVLDLVNGKVPILIELKVDINSKKMTKKLISLLENYEGDVWIQSFSPFVLRRFKKRMPKIRRGQLLMPYKRYPSKTFGRIMQSMITHPISKPNFYSFDKNVGKSQFYRFYLNRFAKSYGVWTLNENSNAMMQDYDFKIMKITL